MDGAGHSAGCRAGRRRLSISTALAMCWVERVTSLDKAGHAIVCVVKREV